MIVGFTITDYRGHRNEAIEFIRKVRILENPKIADNIVSAGLGINIFTESVSLAELKSQPFECSPIETRDGKYLVASAVNFNLELIYNNDVLRLVPTEYLYIEPDEVPQFVRYIKQGLVRIIPELRDSDLLWILETGQWNDNGIWIDNDVWKDNL